MKVYSGGAVILVWKPQHMKLYKTWTASIAQRAHAL